MKTLSCVVAAAAAVLVYLPAGAVLAEDAPKTSPPPSTATTPTPAPSASPAASKTVPTPTAAAEPAKESKTKKAAKMTRHKSAPKPYEHLVPLEQMF